MQNRDFLQRYRLSLGRHGLPVELHRTAVGATYRGHEIATGREVAIDLIPWTSTDPAAIADLEKAAAAARQITHPNIPALLAFGIEEEQLVYVTDSFEGHTAEAWVAARGPLPVAAVLRVAVQVVSALGAANYHRVQHCALNPANVLFVPGQTAEGDWPAIRVLHWLGPVGDVFAEAGKDARADAAARFASPEQLQGGEVDFASSVFSLGCTMWFLLIGAPPVVPGAEMLRARVNTLRGVPKIVRHLLGRMLRVDPAERPRDPVALEAFLQTCLARVERQEARQRRLGFVPLTQPRAVVARTPREWPVRTLALAALLLLCATLAAVAVPRWLRTRSPRVATATPVRVDAPNESAAEPPAPAEGPATFNEATLAPRPAPTVVAVTKAEKPAPVIAAVPAPTAVALAKLEPPVVHQPVASPEPSVAITEKEAAAPNEPEPAETPSAVVADATPSSPHDESGPPEPKQAQETGAAAAPAIADTDTTPPDDAADSTPPEPTATATATPSPEARHVAARHESSPDRDTAAVAKTSRHHTHHTTTRVAHSEVRRARPVPRLHVGSHAAELVGTTRDGRWILSVDSSGERLIVPPPPGYSR